MDDGELVQRVRELRAAGRSPKEIARSLGVRPAAIAAIVRAVAVEAEAIGPGPAVVDCWVSPGWSDGLGVEGHPEWPGRDSLERHMSGLVGVLVAREHRHGSRVSVCGYLVDVYCLGVKDALGPRVMDRVDLSRYVRRFFDTFDGSPLAAPIELAQELVLGAVDYARILGFEPHRDFHAAVGHLGAGALTGAIRFGHDGMPSYVQGPYDEAARIVRTLQASVGQDNFHFLVEADALVPVSHRGG